MIVSRIETGETLQVQIDVMKYDVLASADIFGGISVVLDEIVNSLSLSVLSINIIGEL